MDANKFWNHAAIADRMEEVVRFFAADVEGALASSSPSPSPSPSVAP
jgi:hypothetical protein